MTNVGYQLASQGSGGTVNDWEQGLHLLAIGSYVVD